MKREYFKDKDNIGSVGYIDGKNFHCVGFSINPAPKNLQPASEEDIAEFERKEREYKERQEKRKQKETELLALCGLKHDDFCRFRTVYRDGNLLFISTRENGVNGCSVEAIRNPNYQSSSTDSGDSTYENYIFIIPQE